jgi:hypothetical protein
VAPRRARDVDEIHRASEGNPFVTVEMAREGSPLPARVREIVGRRLERLGDAARRLLDLAAVLGRAPDLDLLARAAGVDDETAAGAIEELVRRHVFTAEGERQDPRSSWEGCVPAAHPTLVTWSI